MKNQISNNALQLKSIALSPLLIAALLWSLFSFAQNPDDAKKMGVLTFDTEIIDYGTITQNANGKRTFTFKNTGEAPIFISKVTTSCGCTVPSYPKTPIMPGEMASIDVKYATNRLGKFTKSVTVISNATEVQKKLVIKGNIIAPTKKS